MWHVPPKSEPSGERANAGNGAEERKQVSATARAERREAGEAQQLMHPSSTRSAGRGGRRRVHMAGGGRRVRAATSRRVGITRRRLPDVERHRRGLPVAAAAAAGRELGMTG